MNTGPASEVVNPQVLYNELLRAINERNIALLTQLLENPEIVQLASANNNLALKNAFEIEHYYGRKSAYIPRHPLTVLKNKKIFPMSYKLLENTSVRAHISALQIACDIGDLELVESLLADPNIAQQAHADNNKALETAYGSINHFDALARRLLALPNVRNTYNALLTAVKLGDLSFVKAILAEPEIYEKAHLGNNIVLWIAVRHLHINIVAELLKIPAVRDIQAKDQSNLLFAAENGRWDIVDLLLRIPTPIEIFISKDFELLSYASRDGKLDIIRQLIKAPEAIPADYSLNCLRIASEQGHTDVIEELLAVFPELRVNTFLCVDAAAHGDLDFLNYLLKTTKLLDTISTWILQALSSALKKNHLSVVSHLLQYKDAIKKGAAYYIKQDITNVTTPLIVAAQKDHREALATLLSIPIIAQHAYFPYNDTLKHTYENKNFETFHWLLDNTQIRNPQYLIEDTVEKDDLTLLTALLARPSLAQYAHKNDNAALKKAYQITHRTHDFRIVDRLLEEPLVVTTSSLPITIAICREDHAQFNKLINNPEVQKNLHLDNNKALSSAAERGLIGFVNKLLDYPAVAQTAHVHGNQALYNAAMNNHSFVVHRLLQLDNVRNERTSGTLSTDTTLLRFFICQNDLYELRQFLNLLKIAKTLPAIGNSLLQAAAQYGRLDAFLMLINIKSIANTIASSYNKVLNTSLEHEQWHIIEELLKNPSVVAKLIAGPSTKKRANPFENPLVQQNPSFYGCMLACFVQMKYERKSEDQLVTLIIKALNFIDKPHVNSVLASSLEIAKERRFDLSQHLDVEQMVKLNHFMLSHHLRSDGAASSSTCVDVDYAPTVLTDFTAKRSSSPTPLRSTSDTLTQVTSKLRRLSL